jgi:ankyrin repeat protein
MSQTEVQMALHLIANGADVAKPDSKGVTAMHLAASSGSREVIGALLEQGAKPTLTNLGYTPLHYCVSTHDKDAAIWDLLLAAGNPIDHVNKWGETPLLSAQSSWNPTAVKYLLAKGANRDIKDGKGKTLVERAAELKQDEILALLK